MAIPQYQIDEWFREPGHGNGQDEAIESILESAKQFAETINATIPDGDAKNQALQFVQQSVMACEVYVRWKWPASKISIVQ